MNNRNKKLNPCWLSLYVYYIKESAEVFLKRIGPVLFLLKKEKLIASFFIVRYHDKEGNHIRIRIKTTSNYLEYTKRTLYDEIEKENWVVKQVDYEPETDRYGGINGLPTCEDFFMHSTSVVIKIIANCNKWTYSNSLMECIKINLIMVQAIEESKESIVLILETMLVEWLYNAALLLNKRPSQKDFQKVKAAFETSYKKQEKEIISNIRAFEQSVLRKEKTTEWVSEWENHCKTLSQKLNLLQINENLAISEDSGEKEIFAIYRSLIHMNNNRLGIRNLDESFICFILLKIMK